MDKQLSKEEILKQSTDSFEANTRLKSDVLEAMDTYAKQTSIAFAEWINNHKLDFQQSTNGNWIGVDMVTYTNETLYELYTQSLNQQ